MVRAYATDRASWPWLAVGIDAGLRAEQIGDTADYRPPIEREANDAPHKYLSI